MMASAVSEQPAPWRPLPTKDALGVYTLESMQSARERLKPDGTLIMYHMSSVRYIAAKIYQMLGQAFGAPPRVYYEYDNLFNYTFVAGYGARGAVLPANAPWLTQQVTLPHDDWPYLYLSSRLVPAHYLAALAGVIVVTLLMLGIGASDVLLRGFDGPMFFMGAGFLLVELMVALPVFFAALIFSTLLSRRADATQALAYNLLGAIAGGVLEYSSMAFGIKALYVIALITYLAAFALSRREKLAIV
jgi:hypothetical protein